MKKLALLFALIIIAPAARATDYTVTTNASGDAVLERARVRSNATICVSVGLPTSCTRAQAIAADPVEGAGYSNTLAVFINKRVKDIIAIEKATSDAEDLTAFEQAWAAAKSTARDSVCTTLGLPAGCKP